MTANNKNNLGYLNKLVDEFNNSYHHSIGAKTVDADYSALPEKLRQILSHINLKLVIGSGLLSKKIFLAKVTLKIGPKKYFLLILC